MSGRPLRFHDSLARAAWEEARADDRLTLLFVLVFAAIGLGAIAGLALLWWVAT